MQREGQGVMMHRKCQGVMMQRETDKERPVCCDLIMHMAGGLRMQWQVHTMASG